EESEPFFVHTPAAEIPQLQQGDASVRVLVGQAFGERSPVVALAPTLYLDVQLPADGAFELPPLAEEMAVYPVHGALQLDGQALSTGVMAVLSPGQPVRVTGNAGARFAVVGGAPLDGPRHMWWNFVSSRKERIVQAAADWEAQRFAPVPGETDFIPLPETRFTP
ncbi:MAG: pirin family protein, partial [Comamonadaceae bacterium]